MPSGRSTRSGSNSTRSSSSAPPPLSFTEIRPTSRQNPPCGRTIQPSARQLIESLTHNRVNTLTELCRIERIATACENEADARAFQEPMTTAWTRYVERHQLLTELRGLTRGYPFSAELVSEALSRVRADPRSSRSWNLAWLCLTRIRDDGLLRAFAVREAGKPEMWAGLQPSEEDLESLARCFEREWTLAVNVMLRHWTVDPSWYR
jgi:hypothetical protein